MPDLLLSFRFINSILYLANSNLKNNSFSGILSFEGDGGPYKDPDFLSVHVCVQLRLMDNNAVYFHCKRKAILALICCMLHSESLSSFYWKIFNSELILWIAITMRSCCESMSVVLGEIMMSPHVCLLINFYCFMDSLELFFLIKALWDSACRLLIT